MRFILFSRSAAVLLLLAGLSACGVPRSQIKMSSPAIVKIPNSSVVDAGFDDTWNKMVKNLSSKFFVINNISKDSRIINVSYLASRAENYIDCGSASINLSDHPTKTIELAKDQTFAAGHWMDLAYGRGYVMKARTVSVEGRVNIYVAPVNKKRTEIKVNSRYIVSVVEKTSLSQPIDVGIIGLGFEPYKSYKVMFNTNQKSEGELVCSALGTLEKMILDTAR